jgi:DNA polymerase-3 subunit epsilon
MLIHFLDTETTGLDPQAHELVEIAIATWNDGEVVELLERPYLPRNGCSAEVAALNGYDEELWRSAGAEHFEIKHAKEIAALVEGALLGGSNPDFDKRMIKAACHRTGQPEPKWSHRSLNTCSLAWPLWAMGQVESASLGALTGFFGIEHAAHSAMGDVKAAIKVWEALFDLYIHKPKAMQEALHEIAEQATGDGDQALAVFAGEAALAGVPWGVE